MKNFLILILCLSPAISFAGGNVMEKVTEGVCECLHSSKEDNQSLKGKEFQNCVQKVAKPYTKELKKQYMEQDGADAEKKFLQKLAMQLGVSMAGQCPDMLDYIMEEFPELQGDN